MCEDFSERNPFLHGKNQKWWDEKQRPKVVAEVRESVMGRLKELKQKTEVSQKVKVEPIKKKGIDRQYNFSLTTDNGGVTRPRIY